MTENKRFIDDEIESVVDQSFTDILTDKTYWIDNGLGDIVNLLNNLYDENEELRKDNQRLRMKIESLNENFNRLNKLFNEVEDVDEDLIVRKTIDD